MTELDWTEKYRPKRLKDVLGNAKAVAELRKWAESWEHNKPSKRAVILAGPPGTGKTSSAIALANEFGWSLVELNASDARNMANIRKVATTGALNQTFTMDGEYLSNESGGRKLIVLDEADSLYEGSAGTGGPDSKDMSDRGGKRAIVDTVERSQQPIILIVNDLYGLTKGSGAALRSITHTIRFNKLREPTLQQAIRQIAEKENIKLTPDVIESIARKAEGDLRACINDLQSLAIGKNVVTMETVSAVGGRDLKVTIFDAIRDVFRGTSTSRIRKTFLNVDETPDNILLWIDENLPYEYKRPVDLRNGYWMLSKADVYLGRVRKRQHWKFMSYSKDLMTAGVASVKQHSYSGWSKYNFPQWLLRMSRSKESRGLYNDLAKKIGQHCHTSTREVKSGLIIPFRHLFRSDNEFAVHMISELNLDRDEIAFLLSDKAGSDRVKSLQEEVKRLEDAGLRGEAAEPVSIPVGKESKKDGKKAGKKKDEAVKTERKPAGRSGKKKKEVSEEEKAAAVIDEAEDDEKDVKKKEVQKSLFDF